MKAILLSALLFSACTREVRYVLAPGTTYGWVVVELRRDCPPALHSGSSTTYVVPASRYLCSSSEPPRGMSRWRYYILDGTGQRHELDVSEKIHKQMHIQRVLPCKYDGDAFYFGPNVPMTSDPDAVILARRPDCVPR